MNIVDGREAYRQYPGPEILEKIVSHLGTEGLKDVDSVLLLDTDENAKWHHGLAARSVSLPGTGKIRIEIFYEGASMPQRLLNSPIFNTYVYARAFLFEIYQHIALGGTGKTAAESVLSVNSIQEWATADAQQILGQLYPASENKEEYRQLSEAMRKGR
jgi:hypothetical protein